MERRALFHHALLGSRLAMTGRLLAEVERTRQDMDRTLAVATVTEEQLDRLDEQVLRYRREYITSAPLPMLYRMMLELSRRPDAVGGPAARGGPAAPAQRHRDARPAVGGRA